MENKNHKKLLCNNIVNGNKCVYRHKCIFAHELSEQKKDYNREYAIKMISNMNDLSFIDIYNNKQLFYEIIILTKECKNCMNAKCTGGYNCKFGTCLKELKVCYDDLMCGKCDNLVNKKTKSCLNGVHLTEKKLIPYNQRQNIEVNIKEPTILSSSNINYNSKINAISIQLTDETIEISSNILKGKISDKDIIKHSRIMYDEFINDKEISKIENLINNITDKNKVKEIDENSDYDDDDEFINEIKNI
jgi:hypothetical protein